MMVDVDVCVVGADKPDSGNRIKSLSFGTLLRVVVLIHETEARILGRYLIVPVVEWRS